MTEREQNLLLAANEVVGDFKSYGPVLQKWNDDYGPESSIGKLGDCLSKYDSEEFTCETDESVDEHRESHLRDCKNYSSFAAWKKASGHSKIKESEVMESIKIGIDVLDVHALAKLHNSLYEDGNITGDDIIPYGDEKC